MVRIARLIGGAGTGKTTEQLRLMEANIDKGFVNDPFEIGYVSMTRAARQEGADRASKKFGCSASLLQDEGYFRTFHSICYAMLDRTSGLLLGDKESREWMKEKLGIIPQRCDASEAAEGGSLFDQMTPQGIALTIWDAARLRIITLADAHKIAQRICKKVVPLAVCEDFVREYERAKYLDNRCDFVDLLARFTGYRFRVDGIEQVKPEGEVPQLPRVWFFDEMQDCSPLVDAVARRLVREGNAENVYLAGDPFQAIYGFAGSDSRCFMGWEVDQQKTMPRTWRCSRNVHHLGEQILQRCENYFDRNIEPADHEGNIYRTPFSSFNWSLLNPSQSWLVLARTNRLADEFGQTLTQMGIPWFPIKGGGGWSAPVRNRAVVGLRKLARRERVTVEEFHAIVKNLPAKHDGQAVFTRGSKKKWDEGYYEDAVGIDYGTSAIAGATSHFWDIVDNRLWLEMIDKAERVNKALDEHGESGLIESQILVGTLHASKGMEADNVLIWPEAPEIVAESAKVDRVNADEERRLQYVGVTRSRGNVHILGAPHKKHVLPFA